MVFETISELWILFIMGVIAFHNIDLKFTHPKRKGSDKKFLGQTIRICFLLL